MRLGLGLGPVFARELVVGSRRWQLFAGRMVFLVLLLVWMGVIFQSLPGQISPNLGLAALAEFGHRFATGMIALQMAVLWLAAPAATAGALCIEKARGTLHHAFLTDLSDREIVRGKLVARLVPVLAPLAYSLPVLSLVGLFGGIDYAALFGAYAVMASVAILLASIGLVLSVWARKPHQALLPTYAFLGVWLFACVLIGAVTGIWKGSPNPVLERILYDTNPVTVTLLPFNSFDTYGLLDQLGFVVLTLGTSWLLLGLATRRVRGVATAQVDRPARRQRPGLPARSLAWLPGPDLDANPILWREWHRKRPGRWVGRAWVVYGVVSLLASGLLLIAYYINPGTRDLVDLAGWINAAEVSVGLLLLGISSASALADERDRGSLDIIMTTPLSTGSIVWGKWWGAFAMVARLAILPTWVAAGLAMVSQGYLGFLLMVLLMLTCAAMVTSLGLAMATWSRRPGRAILATVGIYGFLTVAWPLQIEIFGPLLPRDPPFWNGMRLASPIFGISRMTEAAGVFWFGPGYQRDSHDELHSWAACWAGSYALAALVLAVATRLTFDRRMGRVSDRGSRHGHDSPWWARPL